MKNWLKRMDYPVILVFVGAVLSAFGALWSSNKQGAESKKVNALQQQLIESQKEIIRLSQDLSNNVTGGSSFCYITLSSSADNKIKVEVSHQGKYPLSNVRMYITNLSAAYRLAGDSGPKIRVMSMFRRSSATQFTLTNLAPSNASITVGELDNPEAGWSINDSYFIEFIANNGSWEQQYQTANSTNSFKGIFVVRRNGAVILER